MQDGLSGLSVLMPHTVSIDNKYEVLIPSTVILRYDILALTATTLCLITGSKFVLALHERKNYSTHNPNQDVSNILYPQI